MILHRQPRRTATVMNAPAAHRTTQHPHARRLVHTREIICNGYLRDDGLIDVESTMRDISPERLATSSSSRSAPAMTCTACASC